MNKYSPLDVRCPECRAQIGRPCMEAFALNEFTGSWRVREDHHHERYESLAKKLPLMIRIDRLFEQTHPNWPEYKDERGWK